MEQILKIQVLRSGGATQVVYFSKKKKGTTEAQKFLQDIHDTFFKKHFTEKEIARIKRGKYVGSPDGMESISVKIDHISIFDYFTTER